MNNLSLKGVFTGILFKSNGEVKTIRKSNKILNVGLDFVCDAIANANSRPSPMQYIAVGSGTTAVAKEDTALINEIARKECTYIHTDGANEFSLEVTFGAGEAVGLIAEIGVCNASTGGIFIDRVVTSGFDKEESDIYKAIFEFTLEEKSV